MTSRIEQYALIGDTQTAALVADDGSIDWFCIPRFDSGACFAALLGDDRNGHWKIAPAVGRPRHPAALPRRDPRARDRVGHPRGVGADHRLHADPRSRGRRRAGRRRAFGRGADGGEPGRPLRLRLGGAVGPQHRRHRPDGRGPQCAVLALDDRARGRRHAPPRGVHRARRREGAVHAHLVPVVRTSAQAGRSPPRRRAHDPMVAALVAAVDLHRRVARRGAALARSRSRPSRSRRRVGSSPPPPRRCPSGPAACATGTTGTAGSATRRSPSTR